MKLFEFVVLYHEPKTKKHEDEGREPASLILTDVSRILAKDEKEVAMLAARSIPSDYTNRLSHVEIAIRPF